MAAKMNTATIPCRGGLNLSSNNQELLARPNEAIRLTNFECSKEGGYRRISGYEVLSTGVPGISRVKGIRNYKGILTAKDSTVYHSLDGMTNWTPVNKDADNVDDTGLGLATILPRTDADRYMFESRLVGTKLYIFMVDGVNNPAVFSIIDEATTPLYRYKEIVNDTDLVGAKYCTMVKEQLVLGGMTDNRSAIFYSSHATTDLTSPEDDDKEIPQENFNGSTAGFIGVGDIVTGLKSHREALYVFCESSIHKITGLETGSPEVIAITRDIGCLDGFTIQEVGGDLVYLAPDGLRTVAKTERLDDIELGVISRKISNLIDPRIRRKENFEFYSTVIREKNQYRLWYIDYNNVDLTQRGIIAAYTFDATNNTFDWCFSEMEGLGVSAVDNSYHETKERIVHGNQAGDICIQEEGNTFGGERIFYMYQNPFSDFGDISLRKNMHKVFIMTKPEGDVQVALEVRYDYESSDVHQPELYPMEQITMPFIWGDPLTVWGDPLVKWGARDIPDRDIFTEGSGFTVSFRIKSLDIIDDAPFDIQSLQVDLTAGGKI